MAAPITRQVQAQTSSALPSLTETCIMRIVGILTESNLCSSRELSGVRLLPGELVEKIICKLVGLGRLDGPTLDACACPTLSRLDLRGAAVGECSAIDKIVLHSEKLEVFQVPGQKVSPSTMQLLASKHSSSLKVLDLSTCTVDAKDIQTILQQCIYLEELNLSGCNIDDSCFVLAAQDSLVRPLSRKRRIDFPSERAEKRRKLGVNSQIEIHNVPGRKMRSLKISGCSQLTTETMRLIPRIFPNLLELDCSHIERMININPVLSSCKYLTSLNINGCKIYQDEFWTPPLNLKELLFSGTGLLTSPFLSLLSQCGPNLNHLCLRNKSFDDDCTGDVTNWLSNCTNLRKLDLYGVPVGKNFIPDLVRNCRSTLESLDITHCTGISREHVTILSEAHFPNLQSLTINQKAIVKILPKFSKSCKKLSHLCINLDMKGLLTEQRISQFIEGMSQITELEIWGCKSLSQATVRHIMTSCPLLKSLLLSSADPLRTSSLSTSEFAQLQASYPLVQFKIWHHSITGNRQFRFHKGALEPNLSYPLNKIEVKLKIKRKSNQILPIVLVDKIPIWSNETYACLGHLRKTTEGKNSGALPLISAWCCECDIDNYNGVLFYHDNEHIIWETHEPGTKQKFKFSKEQYTKAIQDAEREMEKTVLSLFNQVPCICI